MRSLVPALYDPSLDDYFAPEISTTKKNIS